MVQHKSNIYAHHLTTGLDLVLLACPLPNTAYTSSGSLPRLNLVNQSLSTIALVNWLRYYACQPDDSFPFQTGRSLPNRSIYGREQHPHTCRFGLGGNMAQQNGNVCSRRALGSVQSGSSYLMLNQLIDGSRQTLKHLFPI